MRNGHTQDFVCSPHGLYKCLCSCSAFTDCSNWIGIVLDSLCIVWILTFLTLLINSKIVFFSNLFLVLSITNRLHVISVTQTPLFSLDIKITSKEKQNAFVNYIQNSFFNSYKLCCAVTSIILSKKPFI